MSIQHASAAIAAIVLTACGGQPRGPGGTPLPEPVASASLVNASGSRVGVATFTEASGGQLGISVSGLPAGQHGLHVHETGTCTPPDFTSAGDHFNPTGREHGSENPQGPHAGDLPNLLVQADGSADTTLAIEASLLAEGSGSILGPEARALVIHADPDDMRTNPSGNSGDRIACGVIERR